MRPTVVPVPVKVLIALAAVCLLAYGGLYWFLKNPVFSTANGQDGAPGADPARLRADVAFLAASQSSRSYHNVEALDAAADYVEMQFVRAGCAPARETFRVDGADFHNIICSFGPRDAERVIVGAHYDVAGDDNPGADDNASGVAGILELARMVSATKPELTHRLDLVAYSLEEPPNFHSATMGSYIHAARLSDEGAAVRIMISVEMIGYYADTPGSQRFPLAILSWFYPSRGNFIAIVGRAFDRRAVARTKALMRTSPQLPVRSINAPGFVPGIDFSDHWGFWHHGLPAVMVTDTAFLRNPNYHLASDTPETLDYERMALAVDGLYRVAVGY